MSGGNRSQLIESELETQNLTFVSFFEINLDFALGQRPGGNFAHAQLLVHYIFTGGELVETGRKIGRNFASSY